MPFTRRAIQHDTVTVEFGDETHDMQVLTYTVERTAVEFSAGSAAQTFHLAAAWLQAHPNARPVDCENSYYGRTAYEADEMFRMTLTVAWMADAP